MLARDVEQCRVVEGALVGATVGGDPAYGGPRLGRYAVLGVDALQRALLEVRMDSIWFTAGTTDDSASRRSRWSGHEVADTDGTDVSVSEQLLERRVRLDGDIEAAPQRLVQEQQVKPVDAELADTLVEGVQRGVVARVADPHLRLDEHVITGDTRAADALADLTLVESMRRRCRCGGSRRGGPLR